MSPGHHITDLQAFLTDVDARVDAAEAAMAAELVAFNDALDRNKALRSDIGAVAERAAELHKKVEKEARRFTAYERRATHADPPPSVAQKAHHFLFPRADPAGAMLDRAAFSPLLLSRLIAGGRVSPMAAHLVFVLNNDITLVATFNYLIVVVPNCPVVVVQYHQPQGYGQSAAPMSWSPTFMAAPAPIMTYFNVFFFDATQFYVNVAAFAGVSAVVNQTEPVDPREVFSERSGFMGQNGYVGGPIREFGCFCAPA